MKLEQTQCNEDSRFFKGYRALEERVRKKNPSEVPVLLYNAFDWRTRIGPFVGPDLWMAFSGIRDVAGALYNSGFSQTRAVFGTWNPNFDFRMAKLNGRIPEVFGVGSMQINSADAYEKTKQARSMGDKRPLIIGGGPHAIYEPWKFFYADGNNDSAVDIAVRGEQNVTLSLMEVLLNYRAEKGNMLQAFEEARRDGALDSIKGLMYLSSDGAGLIDTGTAQVISNFDDLPPEVMGLGLLERKHKRQDLDSISMPLGRLRRNALAVSTTMSRGCNFYCNFCPIPEQLQFTKRSKSPERIVEDLTEIHEKTGARNYFGTDDNAALTPENMAIQYGAMASSGLGKKVTISTEVTEHGLWNAIQKDSGLLSLLREGGLKAFWMGIEDLSGDLIKKGQSAKTTQQLFPLLVSHKICPMPMLIHYDGQPLRSSEGTLNGLINQIDFLRKLGATRTIQITYLGPISGSKIESELYSKGKVIQRAGNLILSDRHADGNHVACTSENPFERQRNIIDAYSHFYNFGNLFKAIYKRAVNGYDETAYSEIILQALGIYGLHKSRAGLRQYMDALATGDIEYFKSLPASPIPIRKLQTER